MALAAARRLGRDRGGLVRRGRRAARTAAPIAGPLGAARVALRVAALLAGVGAALVAPAPAVAQTTLGGQRVGTSSGDFLKIGMGAKAVGLGESFIAIADDPSALYWNPAGIVQAEGRQVHFSHTAWFADVNIEYAAYVMPVPRLAGGVAGIQAAGLWTELDETTELSPDGTGRSFTYSDFVLGVGYARYFTDKFAFGANLKLFREDLGSEVGGGVVTTWLADVGTIYHVGIREMTFAVVITNFGPDLDPADGYDRISRTGGAPTVQETEFIGFAPPTAFKIGLSSRLYETEGLRGIGSIEMNRPGDNEETLKLGTEVLVRERLALRIGYDTNADELKLSGGAGLRVGRGARTGAVDYAFTHSENFGRIDRISLSVGF